MVVALELGVMLFLTWMGLSGFFTPLLLSFGVGSTLVAVLLAHRLGILERARLPYSVGALLYGLWLGREIFRANLAVTRRILSPRLDLDPGLGRVPIDQKTDVGLAVFANSITLTPGTVSVALGDDILVHGLDQAFLEPKGLEEMGKRVSALERPA